MATTASLRLVRVHLKEQLQIQYIHERYSTSAVAYSGKHKNVKVGASVKEETITKARPKLLHPPSKISKEYALKMVLYKDGMSWLHVKARRVITFFSLSNRSLNRHQQAALLRSTW